MVGFLATTLVLVAVYTLLGTGYVVVYRTSRIVNFAHGELMMLGGYLILILASITSEQIWMAALMALLVSFVIGAVIYRGIMYPMIGQPVFVAVIVTIGISILIRGLTTIIWGSSPRFITTALGIKNLSHVLFGGIILGTFDILTIVLTIVYTGAVGLFFIKTRLGIQMRAAAENPLLASQRGINIYLLFALAWGIATVGATMCGILYGANNYLSPEIGVVGLNALVVPMIGGMDSLLGVPLGAVIVGLSQNMIMRYIDPQIGIAVPMVFLLLMLLIRPWGILGRKEEIERV